MRYSCDSSMYSWISSASARAEARSWPNGFSTTTRAPSRSALPPCSALDHRAEQERRDLQVEHRLLRALERRGHRAYVASSAKSPARMTAAPPGGRRPRRRPAHRCPRWTARACSRSSSSLQSSTATPMIGQSSRPRRSSRYSDRNVITLARSPVIPKITNASRPPPAQWWKLDSASECTGAGWAWSRGSTRLRSASSMSARSWVKPCRTTTRSAARSVRLAGKV